MHLSRHPKVVFSAEHTLRPGDGKRSKDQEDGDAIIRDRRAWQHTGLRRRPDADSNQ